MIREIIKNSKVNEAWSEKMFGISKEEYDNITKGKDKRELGMVAMSILSDVQEDINNRPLEQKLNVVKIIIDDLRH